MSEAETSNLYLKIGGAPTIDRLVFDFYNRVLSDSELAPFFENTDMDKLMRMQHEFFSAALGGPVSYKGLALSRVHHGRGIGQKHFARFIDHLLASLKGFDINEADIFRIVVQISDTHLDDVVGGAGLSD